MTNGNFVTVKEVGIAAGTIRLLLIITDERTVEPKITTSTSVHSD